MQRGRAAVKAYGGKLQEATKIAFYAELSPAGEVFYKTEGQAGSTIFAITLTSNQDEVIDQIVQLAKDVLGQQEKQLITLASNQ